MPFKVELPDRPTPEQVRSSLMEAGHYYAGLRSKQPSDRGEGYKEDVQGVVEFIRDADMILTALERGATPPPRGGGISATLPLTNPENLSYGSLVTQDTEYQQFAAQHRSSATFWEKEFTGTLFAHNQGFRATIDTALAGTGGGGGEWIPTGSAVDTPPRVRQMRLFLRDVLAVQGTGLASIPYIRERNAVANELGASGVGEGALKPEVTMQWDHDDAPVRKIAAWVPVTQEAIEDSATLRGYIDTRLAYMLAVREEQMILSGSGVVPQLKGILNFTGLQTQTFTNDRVSTLGLAIGKIESVDGEADAIAMNPTDFWAMVTTRFANQFDGAGTVAVGSVGVPYTTPPVGVWGLPVIRSRAITANTALVGAFRMGATLFDRMQTVIKVGNQHSDFFIANKVAILAEERVALAVHRPDFFVTAALS